MDRHSKNGLKTHNRRSHDVLALAQRIVCNERSERHGDTKSSFAAIAIMWQTYLRATNHKNPHGELVAINSEDVAHMLSIMKKMRFAFGDPQNTDNFIDDIGYTAIATELANIDVPNADGPPRTAIDIAELEEQIRNGN